MTGAENLFIYWPGKHNLGPGWQFLSGHLSTREATVAHLTRALGQGFLGAHTNDKPNFNHHTNKLCNSAENQLNALT